MKKKGLSVLIIEDHPLIIESYKTALALYEKKNEGISFTVKSARNCDMALSILNSVNVRKKLGFIILDISLPTSKDQKILSGEDLGIYIREKLPEAKIIVSTALNDIYRIRSIFKSINPDGFLIKSDINSSELLEIIRTVLNDSLYHSKTIEKLLKKQFINDYFDLDDIDRRILYELSIGTLTKNLPNIVHLSLSTIEKRKRILKEVFNIKKSEGDKKLISIAKERGFI